MVQGDASEWRTPGQVGVVQGNAENLIAMVAVMRVLPEEVRGRAVEAVALPTSFVNDLTVAMAQKGIGVAGAIDVALDTI